MELDHHMNTSYIHVYDFISLTKISEKDYFHRRTNVENGIWRICCNSNKDKKDQLHRANKFSKIRLNSKRVYKYELKLTANIWSI